MYGRRSAAVSASAVPDPPRIQAMLASLANPSSRESSVPPVTTMALCSISPVWPGEAGVFAGGDAGAAFDLFMKISQVKVGFRRDGATGRQPGDGAGRGAPGRPGQTARSDGVQFLEALFVGCPAAFADGCARSAHDIQEIGQIMNGVEPE